MKWIVFEEIIYFLLLVFVIFMFSGYFMYFEDIQKCIQIYVELDYSSFMFLKWCEFFLLLNVVYIVSVGVEYFSFLQKIKDKFYVGYKYNDEDVVIYVIIDLVILSKNVIMEFVFVLFVKEELMVVKLFMSSSVGVD